MSARNLMAGLTAYADPEELAATSVAAQEQQSVVLSIVTIANSVVLATWIATN